MLLSLLMLSVGAYADKFIYISTDNTTHIYKVNSKQRLEQIYYGKSIAHQQEFEQAPMGGSSAYSTFGTNHVFEPALKVTHGDGNTSTELGYLCDDSKTEGDITHTSITLKDDAYDLIVTLHFRAYRQQDIIEQWVEIENHEKRDIKLGRMASSDLTFCSEKYYVTQFSGNWAEEMQMTEQELTPGIKIIDSKLGVRTHQYTHPCFMLSKDEPAAESRGEVVGGTLAWPGNFQFCFEVDNENRLRVLSGVNPFASEYTLAKGKTFKTPALIYTYSDSGTGTVSRRFNRWALKHGIKNGDKTRSVLLNNWEATYFDFDEAKLTKIIEDASKMNFELFLLDDGWFGNKYPRSGDTQGLGDWQVTRDKLPNGLSYLVEQCHKRGMKFGIWIEPEMVNPKSELYEQHPDWVISQPHRERTPQRNQLILDLSNPKVQEFVYNTIDNILSSTKGIDYVKWDCNRFVGNPGSPYLSTDKQSHIWIDYSNALLEIMDRVSSKYPDVTFMACSGGGGRIDYGSMKHFDEYWISDNNDPVQRIFTQWGAQYFFPTLGLASHVAVTPNHISGRTTPLKYRFDVAMSAKLGMDLQPSQMSAAEQEFSRKAIQTYKDIRPTVLHGDLYRLLSPYTSKRAAYMYVNEKRDQAIVFNFMLKREIAPNKQTIFLRGLDPQASYGVSEINRVGSWSRSKDYQGKIFSGEYLMTVGLTFPMYNEYESVVLQIDRK